MFSLINIGERAGSGLPMIYKAWADSDYAMPYIIEKENPDRVCFTLPVECLDVNEPINGQNSISEPINEPINGQNSIAKIPDMKSKDDFCNLLLKTIIQMPYCTKNELAIKLNLSVAKIKRLIADLQKAGKLKRVGSNKKGLWIVVKNK